MSNDDATLWSQTLYEGLFSALKREKVNEKVVMSAIAELKAKQIPIEMVYNQVQRELGTAAVARLKRIISPGGKRATKEQGGLFSFVKKIFK